MTEPATLTESLDALVRTRSTQALQAVRAPDQRLADEADFAERERLVMVRRWRIFAPVVFVLFFLSEAAAWITPEFPKSPVLTGIMLVLATMMYLLARAQPTRAQIGAATSVMAVAAAAYIGTAAADTGRFHSQQILGMAVLFAVVPGILALTLLEASAAMGGSIAAYFATLQLWNVRGPIDHTGVAVGLIYLLFIAAVTLVAVSSNRNLRLREFLSRREVERVHRFAVEEVLSRHLPPRFIEQVLSGQHALDAPPERRLVTVLFADIVGFTPLSDALKPEELGALMARFYDTCAQVAFEHGATIDKFIGDAVMAILGAPESMSAEEQARRALAVARGWHDAVADLDGRRLQIRTGIHQDTVIVGLFGGKRRSDYTVFGRGVNLASRLQQNCAPGEILISFEIWKWLAVEESGARDLGELSLKGIPRPVRAWALPAGRP